MSDRIKAILNFIIEKFETGDIPEAVAISKFPMSDIPSSRWSFLNRIIMLIHRTMDARGFRQWQAVGRSIKGGRKAFYIMVPRLAWRESADGDDEQFIAGFMAKPVFRLEDTAGKPIEIKEPPQLSDLPLMDKAREWGINVRSIHGNYSYYGYFSQTNKEIALATEEESVFFHELAHAAHSKVQKAYKDTDIWAKEVVAELSAAALCRMVGKSSRHLGNSYRYIRHYAKEGNLSPVKACLKVLRDVEKTLGLILGPDYQLYK
jgi:hypothetical protein